MSIVILAGIGSGRSLQILIMTSPLVEAAEVKAAFRKADLNNDGFISKDELKALLTQLDATRWSPEKVDELFENIDVNADDRLKFEEFIDWAFKAKLFAMRAHHGLNLPPTQGSSNAGAFLPGVYQFDYSVEAIADVKYHSVDAVRLLVNAASSCHEGCMQKLQSYVEAVDGRGVICLFDTISADDDGHDSHGTGHINSMGEYVESWKRIHAWFDKYPKVFYEIFNEPFGYCNAELYLDDMREVMEKAGLPVERCIIDGLGYANDVQQVQAAGWPGVLGYHFYPMWLNCPHRTQEGFSNKIQCDLKGVSHKTMITEFGGALNQGDVYGTYHASGEDDFSNVNALRGMHDAIIQFETSGQQVLGLYFFMGGTMEIATISGEMPIPTGKAASKM